MLMLYPAGPDVRGGVLVWLLVVLVAVVVAVDLVVLSPPSFFHLAKTTTFLLEISSNIQLGQDNRFHHGTVLEQEKRSGKEAKNPPSVEEGDKMIVTLHPRCYMSYKGVVI